MTPPLAPPRFAERLLSEVLGTGACADAILGDLHEEHATRARRPRPLSVVRAHGWYPWEAARIGAHVTARTAARLVRRGPVTPPLSHHGDPFMSTLALDLRYALRAVVKRPATSAVIIITLALGLGANAAVFAIIDALVLHPFNFAAMDRLAVVAQTAPDNPGGAHESVAPANFLDWRKQADTFEQLAAFAWWDANLTAADDPQRVSGFHVSADFFEVLGIQPALGRMFVPSDEVRGQHLRVVLSDALWQRRFGADPSSWAARSRSMVSRSKLSAIAPMVSIFRWARKSGRRSRLHRKPRRTGRTATLP